MSDFGDSSGRPDQNPWRTVWKNMRQDLPVNKFRGGRRTSRKMPRIQNPLIIGGLGAAAIGAGAALKYLKPSDTAQQDEELGHLLSQKLERVPGLSMIAVDTKQSFGKPSVVRVFLQVEERPISVSDLLERTARYVWDYATKSPVAVSVKVKAPRDEWTLQYLGFEDEVVRPHELYDRFGAPKSDPEWKP